MTAEAVSNLLQDDFIQNFILKSYFTRFSFQFRCSQCGLEEFQLDTAFFPHFGPDPVVNLVKNPGNCCHERRLYLLQVINQGFHRSHDADGTAPQDKTMQIGGNAKGMSPGQHRNTAAFFS